MNTLLKAGDEVILKIGEEPTDAYGRLLAQVIRATDNLNTNLEMVRKGQATTYFIDPIGEEATYNEFQTAVKEAKDNKLGIWSESNPLLELPFVFRTNDGNGIFDKVVGNSDTKFYVAPELWENVPVEKRIFFWTEEDAQTAGYVPVPQQVEDPNGSDDNIFLQLLSLNDLHGKIDQVYEVDTNGDSTNEKVARMDYVSAHLKEREATNPNTLIRTCWGHDWRKFSSFSFTTR
jgi:2',3'-cyclic-nucleotide 2'-phosphodiesterase/3'-nucleotidase/5'-nucleotidase